VKAPRAGRWTFDSFDLIAVLSKRCETNSSLILIGSLGFAFPLLAKYAPAGVERRQPSPCHFDVRFTVIFWALGRFSSPPSPGI